MGAKRAFEYFDGSAVGSSPMAFFSPRLSFLPSAVLSIFMVLFTIVAQSDAVSFEFKVTNMTGIPTTGPKSELRASTAIPNQPTYRIIAKECTRGTCWTMGINSLAKARNALYSSDNLPDDEPFTLTFRIQRQTPVKFKEAVMIVSTRRASVKRAIYGAPAPKDTHPFLHITGAEPGVKGRLHSMYRMEQAHVAQYSVTTTAKELRTCPDLRCSFSTDDKSRVTAIPAQSVVLENHKATLAMQFYLKLHEDDKLDAPVPSVDHFALAAHFAELAEKDKGDEVKVDEASGSTASLGEVAQVDKGIRWSVKGSVESEGDIYCPQYRRVAVLGQGKATVWYLSSEISSKAVPQIVVAFHGSAKQNAEEDSQVANEQFVLFKPSVVSSPSSVENGFPYLGKVARQYAEDYASIAEELREFMVENASVMVTGFGRSAGMATLATADLVIDANVKIGKLYGVTFGSPQVGDISFLRAFRKIIRPSIKFGYFTRVVAANLQNSRVRVDPEVLMPGAVNEYMATYPSVQNIDCLREFADVGALPRIHMGHLSLYVHVGTRYVLFESGSSVLRHTPFSEKLKSATLKLENDDVYEMSNLMAAYPQDKRMDIYTERLRLGQRHEAREKLSDNSPSPFGSSRAALRKHVSLLLQSVPWRKAVVRKLDDGHIDDHSEDVKGQCKSQTFSHPLTVRLMVDNDSPLADDERITLSICSSANTGQNRGMCHAAVSMSHDNLAFSTVPERRSMKSTYFAIYRDLDLASSHLLFEIVKKARSPNCNSALSSEFPSEFITVRQGAPVHFAKLLNGPKGPSLAGSTKIGDMELSFVIRMPIADDHSSSNEAASVGSRKHSLRHEPNVHEAQTATSTVADAHKTHTSVASVADSHEVQAAKAADAASVPSETIALDHLKKDEFIVPEMNTGSEGNTKTAPDGATPESQQMHENKARIPEPEAQQDAETENVSATEIRSAEPSAEQTGMSPSAMADGEHGNSLFGVKKNTDGEHPVGEHQDVETHATELLVNDTTPNGDPVSRTQGVDTENAGGQPTATPGAETYESAQVPSRSTQPQLEEIRSVSDNTSKSFEPADPPSADKTPAAGSNVSEARREAATVGLPPTPPAPEYAEGTLSRPGQQTGAPALASEISRNHQLAPTSESLRVNEANKMVSEAGGALGTAPTSDSLRVDEANEMVNEAGGALGTDLNSGPPTAAVEEVQGVSPVPQGAGRTEAHKSFVEKPLQREGEVQGVPTAMTSLSGYATTAKTLEPVSGAATREIESSLTKQAREFPPQPAQIDTDLIRRSHLKASAPSSAVGQMKAKMERHPFFKTQPNAENARGFPVTQEDGLSPAFLHESFPTIRTKMGAALPASQNWDRAKRRLLSGHERRTLKSASQNGSVKHAAFVKRTLSSWLGGQKRMKDSPAKKGSSFGSKRRLAGIETESEPAPKTAKESAAKKSSAFTKRKLAGIVDNGNRPTPKASRAPAAKKSAAFTKRKLASLDVKNARRKNVRKSSKAHVTNKSVAFTKRKLVDMGSEGRPMLQHHGPTAKQRRAPGGNRELKWIVGENRPKLEIPDEPSIKKKHAPEDESKPLALPPGKEEVAGDITSLKAGVFCACVAQMSNDCAAPVNEGAGKCIVTSCMKMRCATNGTLKCVVHKMPQYIAHEAPVTGQESDEPVYCTYQENVFTTILAR